MMLKLRDRILRALSFLFSDRIANLATRIVSRRFAEQIRASATDELLELMLRAMGLAFCLSRSYRANIRDFTARYAFSTADGKAAATVRFADGEMHVDDDAAEDCTVRVQFTDAAALRRFLFSEKQDILDSILANEVQVNGNVNYIYKFGFMARDLERRLGILAA